MIEKIAGIALEYLPMTVSASDLGTGRKIFFPIPLKQKPIDTADFVYIYAESKLPNLPGETDVGFTEADVVNATGVYVYRKTPENKIYGEVYPLEVFFREVITDLSLRNRIIFKINEMKALIHIDDEFLDAANMERAAQKLIHKRLH